MKLVEFIQSNPNWKEVLSNPPYSLKIKEDDDYTLFMYDQLNSDFYNPIVKECRGVILDLAGEEPRVVCRAFDKFGNYGEGYVDDIDWSSARVQEKVDGSIIKLWYDRYEWRVSSNSCINAYKANLDKSNMTLGKLFEQALVKYGIALGMFDYECTYIFELVSPYNRVVIDYGVEPDIYYLGRRNNITGKEYAPEKGWFKTPKEYPITSLKECIEAANALNPNENDITNEGYVVVDKNWHRIKIKSPVYVAKHHAMTKKPSLEDMVLVYKRNEMEEFLTYFPAYKEVFEDIDFFFVNLDLALHCGRIAWEIKQEDKKEIAKRFEYSPFKGYIFEAIKYNDWSVERVKELPHEQLTRLIKNYYKNN